MVGDGIDLCLGRQTRKIPAYLRRALGIRDGGCRWPGCHRVTHLQAHHVRHWAHGGHHRSDQPCPAVPDAPHADARGRLLDCLGARQTRNLLGGHRSHRMPGTRGPGCSTQDRCARLADSEIADPGPDAIRSGWAGERFRVAETCGVLLDNTLPSGPLTVDQVRQGDPKPSNGDSGDGGAHRSDRCRVTTSNRGGRPRTPPDPYLHAERGATTTQRRANRAPTPASTPRDEWLESIDLTGVSDEELIDGSFWRKLMDELVEAELAQAELAPAESMPQPSCPPSCQALPKPVRPM